MVTTGSGSRPQNRSGPARRDAPDRGRHTETTMSTKSPTGNNTSVMDDEQNDEPRYRDEGWLREQYVEKGKSTREIAGEVGVNHTTIGDWLNKHNIETTPGTSSPIDSRLSDPEWLREKYVEEKLTVRDIADICDCCRATAHKKLVSQNIEIRPSGGGVEGNIPDERLADKEWLKEQYREKKKSMVTISDECGCHHKTVGSWLRRHNIETFEGGYQEPADERLTDADWLWQHYIEYEKSIPEIANKIGCSIYPVFNWLHKHGIETREPSKNNGLSGENNPQWKGGEYAYGAGWTEGKRHTVRERDNFTCQDPNCEVTQEEHLDQFGERLHVHHLRKARDIDDAEERNSKENLITLCRDCHATWEKMADSGLVPEVVRDD